jgi:hypothetical protein
MFDDLRNSDDGKGSFYEDDQADLEPLLEKKPAKQALGLGIKFNSRNFMGMNAFQRFMISALLLVVVCIMGVMFLMITGSISLF